MNAKPEEWLDLLVGILVQFDSIYKRKNDLALTQHAIKSVDTLAEKLEELNILSTLQAKKASDIVKMYSTNLCYSFQHQDFTPWHIFRLNDGTVGIIDGEHAGYDKPRFTDLAILYMRLCTRCQNPTSAARLLQAFIDKSGIEIDELKKDLCLL